VTEATPGPADPNDPFALLDPGGKVDQDALRRYFDTLADGAGDDERPSVRFVLARDLQTRLDKYLTSRVPFLSRSALQRLIDDGHVLVNDRPAKNATKLRGSDAVLLTLPPPTSGRIEPQDIPVDPLFEDDFLIVLNKQPDIIVHPARSENSGTLLHALAWHFAHRSSGGLSGVGTEHARPGVVHRLDRHTTGCIVFAKDETTHWHLGRQFELRTVEKRYLAVAHGHVEPDLQAIDLPIGPHPSKLKGYREKQVVRHDELGKQSLTICRVRERYRLPDRPVGSQLFSLVELELKTGRTHQIRVHMTYAGHPLIGDQTYGARRRLPARVPGADLANAFPRQALHAATLGFVHPVTGATLTFESPLPPDMAELLAALGG
jgi:23S rRNA pseudouridine1911/1915/1917 synthase